MRKDDLTVRLIAILSLIAGVLCLSGCETYGRGGAGDGVSDGEGVVTPAPVDNTLPLAVEQRFKDIPLPADAREDLERTYVYESDTLEIGRMVYTSKSSVNDLAQFYIRECPVAGWTLGSVMQAEGATLHFSKPDKKLDVRITPQGVGRSNLLIINLTPSEG
jgi:hypothetical protein